MISRVERTRFAEWWWTVDRLMLAAIAVLMMTGIVLSLAASPRGRDAHRARRVLLREPARDVSRADLPGDDRGLVPQRRARSGAWRSSCSSSALALTAATLVFGAEVKGARRWIVLAGVNIQPSEFVKPAFVILISWLFAEVDAQVRHAGEHDGARPARRGRGAARAAAGLRADHADRAGVGRAVLHGRACA